MKTVQLQLALLQALITFHFLTYTPTLQMEEVSFFLKVCVFIYTDNVLLRHRRRSTSLSQS